MPQDGGQRDEEPQIGGRRKPQAAQCQRYAQYRNEALEQVQDEDEHEVAEAEQPADIGRADVSRADRADVASRDPAIHQVAERDRADQVTGERSDQKVNPDVVQSAHWSRPILRIDLSGPPRNAARRASKISLAVA